jgi:hypothetical protein
MGASMDDIPQNWRAISSDVVIPCRDHGHALEVMNRLHQVVDEIEQLRAALASARREARERCAAMFDGLADVLRDEDNEEGERLMRLCAKGCRAMGDE